ncbi:hypothetical protein MMC07_008794 [Pseudocyphellaria aurata]|nr:hypothetical protein [Pseudocyphellaria aurata]
MERSRYESVPMTGKAKAVAVNYHQIAGPGDDEDHTSEAPKQVLEKSLPFSQFFFHFIALFTTAALVGVNISGVYGWDQGSLRIPDNQVKNLLQFAAKLHEIFIVVSLTAIVMHHVRRRLVSSRGLSFGLLSSGYQVSSIKFFFSKSFQSAIFTEGLLFLTVAATMIIVNLVGPSSAIAMIPKLDWWKVDGHGPFDMKLQLYLDGPLDQLYPTNLGPPNMTLYRGCDTVEYTSDCPGAAFGDLKTWAASWYNNGVVPNISMTEALTNTQRALMTEHFHFLIENIENLTEPNVNPNISMTTTLSHPIIELTGLFWVYIQKNSMGLINSIKRPRIISADTAPIYAPVVQVQCAQFNYSDAIKSPAPNNPVVSFPLDVLDNYTDAWTSIHWPVNPSLWNFSRPMNATNFTWVDVSSYSDGDGPGASLGALITLPTFALDNERRNDTFWDFSQQSSLIPCLINAKWAAAKIRYEPKANNEIVQNVTNPATLGVGDGQNVTQASRQPWGLSDTIHISPEWAALLNVAGIPSASASGERLNATMIENLLSQFVISDNNIIDSPYMAKGAKFSHFDPPDSDVVPATIAAVVAEGLSRQFYNQTQPYLVFENGQNKTRIKRLTQQQGWSASGIAEANENLTAFAADVGTSATQIDLIIERYGYGYGFKGSATLAFALGVLLAHAVMAIVYILLSFIHRVAGTGFTSGAWGDMGEMLALALRSERARGLNNVGGGVELDSTWKMRVRVRERAGDRLELVVGREDLDGARPRLNKKYR